MTHWSGEDSPDVMEEELGETSLQQPASQCREVASVRPCAISVYQSFPVKSVIIDTLNPLESEVADGDEGRIDGQSFRERMASRGVPEAGEAWRCLRQEHIDEAQRVAQIPTEPRDFDGAIYFDDGDGGEGRAVRLPPGVPVPSREMVRRHRAAGHSPYRPWCSHCVSGACNAPAHVAREVTTIGDVPEVHCDYGFFKNRETRKMWIMFL